MKEKVRWGCQQTENTKQKSSNVLLSMLFYSCMSFPDDIIHPCVWTNYVSYLPCYHFFYQSGMKIVFCNAGLVCISVCAGTDPSCRFSKCLLNNSQHNHTCFPRSKDGYHRSSILPDKGDLSFLLLKDLWSRLSSAIRTTFALRKIQLLPCTLLLCFASRPGDLPLTVWEIYCFKRNFF